MKLIFVNSYHYIGYKFGSHNNEIRVVLLLKMLYNYGVGWRDISILDPEKVYTTYLNKK